MGLLAKRVILLMLWGVLGPLLAACAATETATSTLSPVQTTGETAPEAVITVEPEPAGTEIDVWFHSGAGVEREALIQIFENFHAAQDDIRVKPIELPEDDYNQQVQAAAYGVAIAGELPCLLDFDGPNTYNYVWNDFLIPLDDYVSEEMKQDFLSSIIAQGTFQDGRLYSLGMFDSGLAIWGNKTYLEKAGVRLPTIEAPWTRAEFEDALARLQALPETQYALDMKMNYGIGEWFTYGFAPILQSFGADLIDRTTYQSAEGVLNGPEAVAALEMIQSWFEQGYVNPAPEDDTAFIEGEAALSWVGHWAAPDYIAAWGDDLVLLPMPDFGHGPKTGMGSWNWAITTNCAHPEAAWAALEFMLQPDQLLIMSQASGAVPARKSVLDQSELYGPDGPLHLYIEQIEAGYAAPRPITPAYPAITRAFAEAFKSIIQGGDVQFQLDQAVEEIDEDINRNDGYVLE